MTDLTDLSDIDPLARSAYSHGRDPIDWAITIAESAITVREEIIAARRVKPGAYPIFKLSLEPGAFARRIVGQLLDAGWTPPELARPPESDAAA